ncbi:MAG: FAD-dependent oxidoreductase, partial [Shewanella sp.]
MKRRAFLSKSLGFSAAIALPFSSSAVTATDNWDREYDLIIVGSGFAGLAAAYSANQAGLKNILVLEKMETWGGNSAICGGLACMPNTKLQEKLGIEDSPELMIQDMMKAGRGFNHPELCKTLANEAHTVYDMLIGCGVEFKDKIIRLGGHSAPRAHIPVNASGGGIVVPMHKYLRDKGVQFQNRTQVTKLLRDDNKAITGVAVQEKFDFYTDKFKGEKTYKSRHGVVVATGGWGQDKKFVRTTMPIYAHLEATAHPGATAGMIKSLL